MSFEDVDQVVEEISQAGANQRLAEGWVLLAVVPGYDHLNAQAVPCYVLGRMVEGDES